MKQHDRQAVLAKAQARARGRDLAGAETLLREWIASQPNDSDAMAFLAQLCGLAGRPDEARSLLEQAWTLDSGNPGLSLALIDARVIAGDNTGASELASTVAAAHPRDARPRVRLANIRMQTGDFAGAAGAARDALAVLPGHAGALSLLAESGMAGDPAALLAEINDALTGKVRPPPVALATLHFAAGRLCNSLESFDEAFDHYSAGNAARRHDLERQGLRHNRQVAESEAGRLVNVFGAASFAAPGGSSSDMPVFVLGMARSGTSLTEQILASHPAVTGAGELQAISRIDAGLRPSHGYPADLPHEALQAAARQYLGVIERRANGAVRVVDKMPMNLLHLGLIARLFPRSRIIHCRRDPMDTCMSCFAENFRAPGLTWAYDLGDLGHMYCQYRRMMEHWRSVLPPGMMLEIDYEETVADLEGQARRLIDFIGLEWDEACLSFHETRRTVFTPSRSQVRRPVYRSSIGRWRAYEKHLAPLITELDACGCGPELSGRLQNNVDIRQAVD